ncbi:MAG: carboxypeptidase M32, partial [Clostridia bacterium]|nr:carboxypeptidase M32 [Clostridia bacterium]
MKLDEAVGRFKEMGNKLHAYQHAMGILAYDGQTGAPPKSYEGRGMSLSTLSGEVYKIFINDETNELINFLLDNKDSLDNVVKRTAEEAREEYDQTSKIPMQEFMEFMKLQNDASHVWHEAKGKNDFKAFEPYLEKLVDTKKKFAAYRNPDINSYNLYLDDFEKGYTMADYDKFFDTLRERLVPLIKEAIPAAANTRVDFTKRSYPVNAQKKLGEFVLETMLLDKERYATAESEHPFTMGLNKNDVRFTTHFYETMPFSALYSTIHEAGHATYELNTADELMFTGLDDGASLGFHESQSRFYENIVGRSREFITFLYP